MENEGLITGNPPGNLPHFSHHPVKAPEAEVGFQPTRGSKPFTGLRRHTVVSKAYADFEWKAPHSRPESNETTIPDNPPRIPPLLSHYPVTIWRRRPESSWFPFTEAKFG